MANVGTISIQQPMHVVLLVPGIRDFGAWTQPVTQVFDDRPEIYCETVGLGYFDLWSFLAPFDQSKKSFGKLVKAYQNVVANYPDAQVSIIAHSFGTYLVGRLLHELPSCKFHRIILCGSVLPADFDWANVRNRFANPGPASFLNICGSDDIWPMIAKTIRHRYGDAGRNGFNSPAMLGKTLWVPGGHTEFFHLNYLTTIIRPFILSGTSPSTIGNRPAAHWLERATASAYLSNAILNLLTTGLWAFFYFILLWLIVAVFVGAWFFFLRQDTPQANQVDLGHKLAEIKAQAKLLDNEEWRRYIDRNYSPSSWVEFDGVIINTTKPVTKSDGKTAITLTIRPADCGEIADATAFEVDAGFEDFRQKIDDSLLLPRQDARGSETQASYARVHIKGQWQNITRRGNGKGGKAFLKANDAQVESEGNRFHCPN